MTAPLLGGHLSCLGWHYKYLSSPVLKTGEAIKNVQTGIV